MTTPNRARPGWLQEKISDAQRAAKPATCNTCGAPVLAGLDDDLCAGFAVVDPTPVNYLEAVAAVLAGRHTYALIRSELFYLEPICLTNGGPQCMLVVQHVCRPVEKAQQLRIGEW